MTLEPRLKVKEVAHITGMTTETVRYWARHGIVPGAAKKGGTWTFNKRKFERWWSNDGDEALCQFIKGETRSTYDFKGEIRQRGESSGSINPLTLKIDEKRKDLRAS